MSKSDDDVDSGAKTCAAGSRALPCVLIHQVNQLSGFATNLIRFLSTMAASKATLTHLKDLQISSHQLPAFDGFPNTSIQRKPLLIYHKAFHPGASASAIKSHLSAVGIVEPQWVYTMYRQVAMAKCAIS